jgi:V/A-type H+-transporting ATPase subunit E
MAPVEGNIEMLSSAILSEAQTEADQILAEAREKVKAIKESAESQIAAERTEILNRAQKDAERIRRQAVATAQIKARTVQLEHREKLLDSVFEAARQQLPTVQQWSEYGEISQRLLCEALIHLGAEKAIIKADETTRRLLTAKKLEEISKEVKTELGFGDNLKKQTGVIVEAEGGRLRYDNTLETRLGRLQNETRSPVYHLLMGESL